MSTIDELTARRFGEIAVKASAVGNFSPFLEELDRVVDSAPCEHQRAQALTSIIEGFGSMLCEVAHHYDLSRRAVLMQIRGVLGVSSDDLRAMADDMDHRADHPNALSDEEIARYLQDEPPPGKAG